MPLSTWQRVFRDCHATHDYSMCVARALAQQMGIMDMWTGLYPHMYARAAKEHTGDVYMPHAQHCDDSICFNVLCHRSEQRQLLCTRDADRPSAESHSTSCHDRTEKSKANFLPNPNKIVRNGGERSIKGGLFDCLAHEKHYA